MNKSKILRLFLKEPSKEQYIREIARRIKKSPTTVSVYLAKYEKRDLLKSERKYHHLVYKANQESKKFKRVLLYYNLTLIDKSGLIKYLEKEFNHPETIGLFGSFVKGENVEKSDIDIYVISPLKKEISLNKYEKKLKHKIQLFVFSREDIKKMQEKNKELLNSLINGVVLSGFLEIFK